MTELLFSALKARAIAAMKIRSKGRALTAGKGAISRAGFAPAVASIAIAVLGLCFLLAEPSLADQASEVRASVPAGKQMLSVQIADLKRKVQENPRDGDAWAQIGTAYFLGGAFDKAAEAFRKTIDLGGESEDRLLGLGEALTAAQNGEIPEAARQAFAAAVAKNPTSQRARLWVAIADEQEGKKAGAEKTYTELLNENPSGTLKRIVTERLANLYSPPAESENLLAPNSANPHAQLSTAHGQASGKTPKGHEGGSSAMVDKLAQRLKENKGSLEQWLMLIRSYYVLNEKEKAQDAVSKAKNEFSADAKALEEIDSLVRQATSPDVKAAEQTSGGAADGDHGQAIRGMVAGLTQDLKENKGDLEGWLKLIRSYAALKETDKAQDAVSSARQQFAADAKALDRIDSLLREVKLTAPSNREGIPKS